jgi:outer membrane protein TolC
MKIRYVSLLFLFILAKNAMAQNDTVMSLKECVEYALKNSSTIQNARLDEYIAASKIGETRAIGLPQISAKANAVHNPELQRMFFKGDNQFLAGTPAFTGNPNDVAAVPNFFMLPNSGEISATATQLIFSGAYIVGLQTSKIYAQLSSKASQKASIDVVEAVKKAYYMVLINKDRLESLNNNLSRLDTIFKQTQSLNKNGFVEKIDVSRLEVRYLNLLTEKQKFENMASLALALLKFQMGMPTNKGLQVNGSISELKNMVNENLEMGNLDYNNRIEYSLLQTQKLLNRQNIRYLNSNSLPTLAAFGTYGFVRSDVKFLNLLKNQLFSYSMVGLNLNVPIFDGMSKYYKKQQAKLEMKKTENAIANLEMAIDMQTTQAKLSYTNAIKTMKSLEKNLALSSEVARVSKVKYQEGVGSNLELINAESDLKDAQANYYDAIYQALVSLIDYQKAIGKLSNE